MIDSSIVNELAGWKPQKLAAHLLIFLIVMALIVSACVPGDGSPEASAENVLFESNIGAEFTGFTISFQYPRELEVGYFSDSGAFGWMVSDADPQDVFWSANQTGEEISILLMLSNENEEFSGHTPVQLLEEQFSQVGQVEEFTENEKQVAYYYQSGEVRAAIVAPGVFLILSGNYPAGKEELARKCVDAILHSVEFHDAEGRDFSSEIVWGTRREGPLAAGAETKGYLPLSSGSSWEIKHKGGPLTLNIDALSQEAEISVDILDKDGKSVLAEGAISFTGKLEDQTVSLPGEGIYTLQILPQSEWYGWYEIQIK